MGANGPWDCCLRRWVGDVGKRFWKTGKGLFSPLLEKGFGRSEERRVGKECRL